MSKIIEKVNYMGEPIENIKSSTDNIKTKICNVCNLYKNYYYTLKTASYLPPPVGPAAQAVIKSGEELCRYCAIYDDNVLMVTKNAQQVLESYSQAMNIYKGAMETVNSSYNKANSSYNQAKETMNSLYKPTVNVEQSAGSYNRKKSKRRKSIKVKKSIKKKSNKNRDR